MRRKPVSGGAIAWMAGNSVAANLIMLVCLVGGLIMTTRVKQEVFPEFSLDTVEISVVYPGASPEEVEQGIILAVEDGISGLEGIKEITSVAREGRASITVEAVEGSSMDRLYLDIKAEVDRITSFPEDIETPQVILTARKRQVMSVALYGPQDVRALRDLAETVRDDLLQDPEITQVELSGVPNLEIALEVSQQALRTHGLSLPAIADAVTKSALELPGGAIKTQDGEILVRVKERKDFGFEFARLPLITTPAGAVVTVGDVATITDGLEDTDLFSTYNGQPAVLVDIFRVGMQTPISVSNAVKARIERLASVMPPDVHITIRSDDSDVFRQRMDLLVRNGLMGLCLVFILLALFLEIRLAFWVSMGIPISFLGSFLLLPAMDVSFNMVSMFAFIVTLGIVVDDAVVVGENIYQYREKGHSFLKATVLGAREVSMPVVFSVLTNMAAFVPMFFIPGTLGKVFGVVPGVVVSVFAISLIESLFVLPAHLGHQTAHTWFWLRPIHRLQDRFSQGFIALVQTVYPPLIRVVLRHRYVTLAIGAAILAATGGYVASGRMGMTMFPKVEADFAYAEFSLPFGAPPEQTLIVAQRLTSAAQEIASAHGGDQLLEGIFAQIGTSLGGHQGSLRVYLTDPTVRPLPTAEFTRLWRQKVGSIVGLETLRFESDRGGPGAGAALTVELSHRSTAVLEQACADLAKRLEIFAQVSDIDDGFTQGKPQFDVRVLPEGRRLGFTPQDVARQIRASLYGAEALRQQRGRNEIKIMVRLPEKERSAITTLDDLMLRAPSGTFVPLRQVVELTQGRSYTTIDRRGGRRTMSVTADVTPQDKAGAIVKVLQTDIMPELVRAYPGLEFSFEGKQADMRDSVQAMIIGQFMALLALFALLAIPLRSYFQPLIIMASIPFGLVGAILGHLLLGYSLSIVSLFGIVALSGVVINDSLVLITTINQKRQEGESVPAAVMHAATQRFRPILLTTVTTFGGLAPMIWETSRQARFLIPMAISLGFGVLFATFITLAIVPSLYMVGDDFRRFLASLRA